MELTGKSVAIVGGMDCQVKTEHINSYDVVVQLNYHWPKRSGTKIDILWHQGSSKHPPKDIMEREDFLDNILEIVTTDWSGQLPYVREYCSKHCIPLTTYGFSAANHRNWWYINLDNYLKSCGSQEVFTGIAALMYFLRFDVREVRLFNMNLYASNPDASPNLRGHSPRAHAMFMRWLLMYDGRIKTDTILTDAIHSLLQEPLEPYLSRANLQRASLKEKAIKL